MTCVVLGASSGLGRHVAECLAEQGSDLVLMSRDLRDSQAVASDLCHRYGIRARAIAVDLAQPIADFRELDATVAELGRVNVLVVAAGEVSDADQPTQLATLAEPLLRANFLSACLVAEHLLPELLRTGNSVIVGIGSIAAFRGRARNVVYAASKRALHSYFESLMLALSGRGVRVQFYHVGFLDTNLSFGRPLPLPAASARKLARRIAGNIAAPSGVFFHPRYWRAARLLVSLAPLKWFRHVAR